MSIHFALWGIWDGIHSRMVIGKGTEPRLPAIEADGPDVAKESHPSELGYRDALEF